MTKILKLIVQDIRFPTSKDLTGSDAIHTDPDYSATYLTIQTTDPKLTGYGIAFTIGKGNNIVAKCIEEYFHLFEGLEINELENNIGKFRISTNNIVATKKKMITATDLFQPRHN